MSVIIKQPGMPDQLILSENWLEEVCYDAAERVYAQHAIDALLPLLPGEHLVIYKTRGA